MNGNLAEWSAIVAFFLPLLVAVVNRTAWLAHVKALIFFAASLIAAGVTAALQGDLNGHRFLDSALIIVSAGIAFYKGVWKPVGVLDAVESATG